MTDRPNYSRATNLAYEVFMNYDGIMPKINIFKIVSLYRNIKVYTYSQASERFGCSRSYFTANIATSEHGFTISDTKNDMHLVFYNELKCEETIRFTLAHELGHILLRHNEDCETAKKEANCFARNILCPLPIVDGFKLASPEDYEQCFEISEPMAQVAIAYKSSDSFYVTKKNFNIVNDKVYCYFSGYSLSEIYA